MWQVILLSYLRKNLRKCLCLFNIFSVSPLTCRLPWCSRQQFNGGFWGMLWAACFILLYNYFNDYYNRFADLIRFFLTVRIFYYSFLYVYIHANAITSIFACRYMWRTMSITCSELMVRYITSNVIVRGHYIKGKKITYITIVDGKITS